MRALVLLALLALSGPSWAAEEPNCQAAQEQAENAFPLPHAAQAIAGKRLSVLVVGAGSSALPGADGAKKAYPGRLQAALEQALPQTKVDITSDVQPRRTAEDMAQALGSALAKARPQLVIWQTGTVDAMRSVELDQFSDALEQGISAAKAANADMILINAQYSPRTDSMIALGTYSDLMRRVAAQQEVPLFDRFAVMKAWSDLGIFDFYATTKKLDMAEHVHNCIGRLLADLVLGAVKQAGPPG
jgi:GDSL-like Lipase/Acylhydrolase family